MRLKRSRQFDESAPPWLHCISRCVRRAFLCGDGYEHRKSWIERRLRVLSRTYAVDVGAYAVMSNHLHAVLRPRPARVATWSPAEVVRAWWHARNDVDPVDGTNAEGVVVPIDEGLLTKLADDLLFVAEWRSRLGKLSWFMKELKEPLSRAANREDDVTGAFWEGRFTSIPLLDVAAIVACMAYVDLNPIRAQLATVPEDSEFTSIKVRIEQRHARQRARTLRAQNDRAAANTVLREAQLAVTAEADTSARERRDEHSEVAYRSWLTPISEATCDHHEGDGMRLDTYITLVEATGRLVRGDKRGAIPAELPAILARLNCTVDAWLASVAKPRGLRGSALGSIAKLGEEATRRGLKWLHSRCALFARERQPPRTAQSLT